MEVKKGDISNEPHKTPPPPQYVPRPELHEISQAPLPECEGPPIYSEDALSDTRDIMNLQNDLFRASMAAQNLVPIWQSFIDRPGGKEVLSTKDFVVNQLFTAIREGEDDLVALLIENNIVTPNTTLQGETPLLAAVATRNIKLVEKLLGFGADQNAFGAVPGTRDSRSGKVTMRTPLQLAASMGQLVLVKLLIEHYHCDDALIAPDGQIALRLASQNGHREVVQYLPARRGGGFRRWKHDNRKALQRGKKACKKIGHFGKFFIWDIEKFFLWTTPKHLVVKPLSRICRWCWEHRAEFGPWCKSQALKMPARVKRFVKWLAKIPRAAFDMAIEVGRASWRIATEDLPRIIRQISVWVWRMLTVKIPKALAILGQWVSKGLSSVAKVIWNGISRVVSWIATMVEAIVSFFRLLTLADVWNGFVDVLHAIFIALPKVIASWVRDFGDASYKIMTALFGEIGLCIWFLGTVVVLTLYFLPKQIWVILKSFGEAIVRAGHEIRVWLNPKAI
ncbi:hypothetical protein EG329_000803 [Mollisiaceae sp. DMI_Dod_QoI]|nr:hypothetical protein EG329_000803 [Helotiales sp. DMI_Dod_QoI]